MPNSMQQVKVLKKSTERVTNHNELHLQKERNRVMILHFLILVFSLGYNKYYIMPAATHQRF